jgi:heme exporter protein D
VNTALIGALTSVVMSILGIVGWVSTVRNQDRARREAEAAKERQRQADLAAAKQDGRAEKGREMDPELRRLERELGRAELNLRDANKRIDQLEDLLRMGRRSLLKPPSDEDL